MMNYTHGGDIYSFDENSVIDFSSNINPLGIPETVRKVFENPERICTAYPDPFCRRLIEKISEFENINREYILCGSGAAELIYKAAFVLDIKKALMAVPTFSEYEKAVRQFGGTVSYFELKKENSFNLTEDFIRTIEETNPDAVFICNPNNPTGQTVCKELLTRTAELCGKRKIKLIIDECFLDFVPQGESLSMKNMAELYPDMIILKAFTKFFAMPGLRLGYLITSDKALIDKMWNCGQPWSVSAAAQECGAAALEDKEYINKTKREITVLRNSLMTELRQLPISVFESKANYILFYTDKKDLCKSLLEYNILIRDCSNYKGLEKGYFRTAVKSEENNKKLIDAMKKIFSL